MADKVELAKIIYTIDWEDKITSLSDNWVEFAERNHGMTGCKPSEIINRPIWDFIAGPETSYIYELLFKKVRDSQRNASFPIRCDSPKEQRKIHMILLPSKNDGITTVSKMIEITPQTEVQLLRNDIERTSDIIRMCSYCKAVEDSEQNWVSLEDAVNSIGLFTGDAVPQISHGICSGCNQSMTSVINALEPAVD